MKKKIISLSSEGKLVLKSPNGKEERVNEVGKFNAYLVIDCSGSMSEGNKLSQAKNGAIKFAKEALEKSYQIGLIKFESMATHLCDPQRNLSILIPLIDTIEIGGSTNMTDAIKMANERLLNKKGISTIVIVTDGMPDNPNSALEVARKAKEKGIKIIAIGTDDADQKFLKSLASETELSIKVDRDQLEQSISSAAKLLPKKR